MEVHQRRDKEGTSFLWNILHKCYIFNSDCQYNLILGLKHAGAMQSQVQWPQKDFRGIE